MRFAVFLGLLLATSVRAQDDELTEAPGLAPETRTQEAQPEQSSLRARGYGMIDWRRRKGRLGDDSYAPNLELSLALQDGLTTRLSAFAEGRAFYLRESEETSGVLDQGGLRMNLSEHWSVALGKERNRRAPGLLISPSDFLHSNQSAPGLPEDRSGVWLARLSWQTEDHSLDVLILPVSAERGSGLPDEDSEFMGTALRWFSRFSGYDLSLDLGYVDDDLQAGSSIQSFFFSVWKSYLELGYNADRKQGLALFGLSYEGSDDFSLRAEVYHSEADEESAPRFVIADDSGADAVTTDPAAATQGLFLRRDYFIGNLSLIEVWNRWNLRETWIKSLEDSGSVHLFGADCILGDRQTMGLTWIRILGDKSSQYAMRPFDWQLLFNWKYSF